MVEETKGYSVLMSVYHKENAAFLREAIDSMLHQTLPPEEFILVCDGPLTPDLEAVIAEYKESKPPLTIVRLPQNRGLAPALNEGLRHCTCPYVARMDSDDISLPDRMAREMEAMLVVQPTVLSGALLEFENNPDIITGRRVLPRHHADICRFGRWRSPINNGASLFRRDPVIEAGGFGDVPYFEDYQLWIKLFSRGGTGYNLPEPVLKVRTGSGMHARRGGLTYLRCILRFERFKRKMRFSTFWDYCFCVVVKGTVSLFPVGLRTWFYNRFLRKQ